MPKWICSDGHFPKEIEADDQYEAAREYVLDGYDNDTNATVWVRVFVCHVDSEDYDWMDLLALDPNEPKCELNSGHNWIAPHELVGGMKENPGVFGNGGGIIIHTLCKHCGIFKIENTWAQDPHTGTQGLHSIEYKNNS